MMASLAPKWFLPSQRWIAFLGISTISTKISDVISNALDTTSLDLISHCHYFHIYLWSVLHCSTFKVAGYFETCICSEQYKCSKLAHTQCTAFILDFGSLSIGSPQEIVQHGFRGRYIVQCIQLLTLFSLSPSMYLCVICQVKENIGSVVDSQYLKAKLWCPIMIKFLELMQSNIKWKIRFMIVMVVLKVLTLWVSCLVNHKDQKGSPPHP